VEFSVVNYTPFTYIEKKPSVIPEEYVIPAAVDNEKIPGILHIKPAYSRLHIPLQEHIFKVPVSGEALAQDLVRGLVSAFLEYEADVAQPALFCVPGIHTAGEVKLKFAEEIKSAMAKQNIWLMRLVKKADDEWQKFRQHKFITDYQRWAAKKLGFKKEWGEVSAAAPLELDNCKFCGTQIFKSIALCPNCKNVVNPELYKSLTAEVKTA